MDENFEMTIGAGLNNNHPFHVYKQGVFQVTPEIDPLAFILISNEASSEISFSGYVRSVPYSEIENAGYLPYWSEAFDPQYIISPVLELYSDGIN